MDVNFNQYFIDKFLNFASYDEAVSFAYITIDDVPTVERVRYGSNERYCVYLKRSCKMAVLAQCARYDREELT